MQELTQLNKAKKETTKTLTIIIVSYNSKGVIFDCIRSIYSTVTVPFELIIVDNNSSDNTINQAKQQFPDAHIIHNNTNRGYGPACNQAIKIAQGKHILLLNQDVILEKNTVNELLSYLASNNDARIVSCKLKNKDNTTQESFRTFPTIVSLIKRQITKRLRPTHTILHTPTTPLKVDWVSGALMLLREKYYFDEKFFFYFEDVDLCKRTDNVYYYPCISAHHAATRASSHNIKKAFIHTKSAFQYFFKHGFF